MGIFAGLKASYKYRQEQNKYRENRRMQYEKNKYDEYNRKRNEIHRKYNLAGLGAEIFDLATASRKEKRFRQNFSRKYNRRYEHFF